nr:MAG TPA: hypothetical protein [Caudoviricetes sp.]
MPNPLPPVLVSPTTLVLKLYRYCALLPILHRSWLVTITAPALQPRQARAILHSFGCSRCSLSRYSPISFNPKREKPRIVFWKRERRSKL